MICGIYSRKSTSQVADSDVTSIARQIESARAFAAARGWTVDDRHVYSDAAISGAETQKLVQRRRLLDAIALDPPPFDVLIMRDDSRFSRRDGDEAFGELKRVARRVAIWFYQDGTQFTYGDFAANITGIVRAEMNAEYRRQIGRLTSDTMIRKAKAGHHVGGRVFGYDLVDVINGQRIVRPPHVRTRHPEASHVELRVNEEHAAVVRRIFSLSASGWGYARIAKQLNEDRTPAPRPQQSRPAGWAPTTVYEVLHRPLYRGEVVWNQTRKRDSEGKTAATARPESEWLRSMRPELRIVSDEEWAAAHTRLNAIRVRLTTARGSRPAVRRDVDSKYFLSGFSRCGTCGGTLSVVSRSHGRRRAYFYGCLAHAKRGRTVCDNNLVLPVERVDAAVLSKLTSDVLRPKVIRAIIDGVFEAIEASAVAADVASLRRDLAHLDRKITNLANAVENGATVAPLVTKLQERQTEREQLTAAIAAAEAVGKLVPDRRVIERAVLEKVEGWKTLLRTDGRQVLREVLEGPIRFTPDGKQYQFHADTTAGAWIAGLVGIPPSSDSARGRHYVHSRQTIWQSGSRRRFPFVQPRPDRSRPNSVNGQTIRRSSRTIFGSSPRSAFHCLAL